MNRPSAGWIVCLLLCGMLIAGVFYLIGYKAAYDRMENIVPSTVEVSVETAGGKSMWKLMGGLLALPVLLVLSALMIFLGQRRLCQNRSAQLGAGAPRQRGAVCMRPTAAPALAGTGAVCTSRHTRTTAGWRKP
ncbi:MAG: hypothetical protein ACLTG0_08130 [Oscillibacter sp.]